MSFHVHSLINGVTDEALGSMSYAFIHNIRKTYLNLPDVDIIVYGLTTFSFVQFEIQYRVTEKKMEEFYVLIPRDYFFEQINNEINIKDLYAYSIEPKCIIMKVSTIGETVLSCV